MSHVPHELAEEFPNEKEKLHDLKLNNAHFAKISDRYHELNRELHRVETGVEPASQIHEVMLRKERMTLKDEISGILQQA